MSATDLLTPIIGEVGIGGVGGFVVGYALKKLAKLLVILLALGFIVLEYLAYIGVISIDYTALYNWALGLTGQASGLWGIVTTLVAHIPFGASFAAGFFVGLKMG
jgi:uncharacterized membrane protein (Fun14 family)